MFTLVAVAFTSSQAQYQLWINHLGHRTCNYSEFALVSMSFQGSFLRRNGMSSFVAALSDMHTTEGGGNN